MPRLTTLAPRLASSSPGHVSVPAKRAEPFYQSAEWKELRAYCVARARGICQHCGSGIKGRAFADHIRELRDGGAALDSANVQVLCAACHNRKTAAERTRRHQQRFSPSGTD
jgi:5-methylcytosine-specific restriction protein A